MSTELPVITRMLHKIMHYIPHVLIMACVAFSILFAWKNPFYFTRSLLLFVPLIITSIVLIVNKRLSLTGNSEQFIVNHRILGKIAYILLSLLVVISCIFGFESPLFLVVAVGVYSIILIQALSNNARKSQVLIELIIATSILIFTQLFGTPLWYGDTDLISHYEWAGAIVDAGFVPVDILGAYGTFCLYHVLIAITNIMSGLAPNISLYLISTVGVIFTIPIVYGIAKYFTNSTHVSILATVFYGVMPMMLTALLTPAPRVMASMAFILVVYVFFTQYPKRIVSSILLMLILVCYMALVHHAQLLFILLVFGLLFVGGLLYYRHETQKRVIPIALVAILPLISLFTGYWDSVESIIKNRLFGVLSSGDGFDSTITTQPPVQIPVAVQPSITPTTPPSVTPSVVPTDVTTVVSDVIVTQTPPTILHTLISMIPVIILAVFCLVGIYFFIKKTTPFPQRFSVLIPCLLILFVPFVPNVLDIFQIFADSFQIYRIRLVLAPFFAIAMATGVFVLLNMARKKSSQKFSRILVIGLCLCFVVGSVSMTGLRSNDIFDDNRLIIPQATVSSYVEQELSSVEFIPANIPVGASVYSYGTIAAYITRTLNLKNIYDTNYWEDSQLYTLFTTPNYAIEKTYYAVLSEPRFDKVGLNFYSSDNYADTQFTTVKKTEYSSLVVSKNLYPSDIIYDNWYNDIYYSR